VATTTISTFSNSASSTATCSCGSRKKFENNVDKDQLAFGASLRHVQTSTQDMRLQHSCKTHCKKADQMNVVLES
jgi:spore coat protein U-like protein